MKRLLITLFLLAIASSLHAADLITTYIVITNNPTTNAQTFTLNGSTLTWTNDPSTSPSTLIAATNSPANAATNFLNHVTIYPFDRAQYVSQTSPTNVTIRGKVGQAMIASAAGGWAVISNFTNQASSPTYFVRVPLSIEQATNQTNIATLLVTALESSIKPLGTNATAGANYLTKGASATQTVAAPVIFNSIGGTNSGQSGGLYSNAAFAGTLVAVTNGLSTNLTLLSPKLTNGANYGSAFRSPGSYPNSDQFGSSAAVVGGNSIALGPFSSAGSNSVGAGYLASAGYFSVSVGSGADTSVATNSLAIGQNSTVGIASNASAIGQGSIVGNYHHGSTAIGQGASTTTNSQIMLGSSSTTVVVPGLLSISGTQSNTVFKGTNIINGRVDFTSRANAGLANGNNAGVILGTNVYVRLSGATTIAAINGFASEQDGSWHIVQISGAITNIISNDSGSDPTTNNRIITGIGADVAFTNNPTLLYFIYDAAAFRWRLRMDR